MTQEYTIAVRISSKADMNDTPKQVAAMVKEVLQKHFTGFDVDAWGVPT